MDLHAKNSALFFSDADIASDHAKNSGRFLARKFEQRNSVHVFICQITEGKTHQLYCVQRVRTLKIGHYFSLI